MASIASPEPAAPKSEKKSKKDKSSKSEKKRAREEDAAGEAERKHKKSKSVLAENAAPELKPEETPDVALNGDSKAEKKKKKKEKKEKHGANGVAEADGEGVGEEGKSEKKKSKKKRHSEVEVAAEEVEALTIADDGDAKKKKKKSKKDGYADESATAAVTAVTTQEEATEEMEVDTAVSSKPSKSSSKIHQPPDIPADPQFPFFTQTVSLYEPLYPIGWAQPVTNCQYQHLQHLQNKYVPSLGGVLMDYKNVAFGEQPGRKGAATDDEQPTKVISESEYAVGYGWITADVDLFVPSRGAWMEGSVNLQTEGHIGVVCFGKFNASIEARRLPPSWKWVPNESAEVGFEETASVFTADDHGVVRQMHSTGFWTDESGERIKGKIRFRIRNFDVGTNGETSYLSLEGTMLDKKGEKALVADEARTAKMRKAKKGGVRHERRRIPDFAMTRFAVSEEEQQENNEAEKREVLAVDEEV